MKTERSLNQNKSQHPRRQTMPFESLRFAKDLVIESIEAIEKLYQFKGAVSGLSTGFFKLDQMTDGLHPGEMIVIAGRPGMGKTALALNIAEHVAINCKLGAVIFSLERRSLDLTRRLLCSRARIDSRRLRDGYLIASDFPSLTEAASSLANAPLLIDESPAITVQELSHRLREYVCVHGVRLAVIDYLQLLRSSTFHTLECRRAEIEEISSLIKALARELEIPIIVLSPLNRHPEDRKSHRLRPREVRDSQAIAQYADVVALLVREEYYAETKEEKREAKGKATLIIAKQYHGPLGDLSLRFEEKFGRFQEST
jgi:replicative DNA helicase